MLPLVKNCGQSWKASALSISVLSHLLFVKTKPADFMIKKEAGMNLCLFIMSLYLHFSLPFSEPDLQGISMSWCMHFEVFGFNYPVLDYSRVLLPNKEHEAILV